MYLPFIAFLFIAVGLLQLWKASRSTLIGTLAVILLVEAGLAYQRNVLWGSAIGVWADSVSKSPQKWRPNFQLAYAYYSAQQCAAAVNQFSKTATLEKPDYSLLIDWGLAADCAGNSAEALAKLQQAASLEQTAHVYSQIGMEYAKLQQFPQALDTLNRAATLDPNFERTYIYRGNVYFMQGKRAEAAADYQRALQINPSDQYAREFLMKSQQR
jgi:tetratricopeptide (TPR) repeat protein